MASYLTGKGVNKFLVTGYFFVPNVNNKCFCNIFGAIKF